MARRKDGEYEEIGRQMAKVIGCITDRADLRKVKKWDDLVNVAYQWCCKNYSHHIEAASEWGVSPIDLLLTALLYVEHPLLMDKGRMRYGFLRAKAEIIIAQLEDRSLFIPVSSTDRLHRGVDRIVCSVDRIAESAQKSFYPQEVG